MFKIKIHGVVVKYISILLVISLALVACKQGETAEVIKLTISPKLANLVVNENKQFSVIVTGTTNTAVDWIATGGNVINGLYTAGPNAGDFSITVRSQADPSKTDSAVIIIKKKTISLNPDNATILAGGQIRFNVVGLQNDEVTWSTNGGAITQAGIFTAGNEAGDFKVGVRSKADPSITAVAAVRINKKAISISISPKDTVVYTKNTWQFKASVTGTDNQKVKWTVDVGSIDGKSGLYTAPDNTDKPEATITATSQEDTSVKATTKVKIRQAKLGWHAWLATDVDDFARAMAIDKEGSVYLTGFMDSTDKGLFDNADHARNSREAFLVKYDKNGVYKWHVWLQSRAIDYGKAVATDNAGNVYIAIETNSKVLGNENKGGFDVILAKYDKNGNYIWDTQIASDKNDRARYLTTDSAGNIYLAIISYGEVFGTANNGEYDILVIKYAKDGTKQWHTSVSSATDDRAISLSVDLSGNVYLGGLTQANPKSQDLTDYDAFVTKIDKSGNVVGNLWLASPKFDGNTAAVIDDKGNLLVIVETRGDLFGENQGETDSYLIKYDSDGDKVWHRQIASDKDDKARALTVDNKGNVYVTGYSYGGLFGETAKGDRDIFVVKYDSEGNKIWHKWLATDKLDYARAIVVDNATGKVYIAGRSKGNLVGDDNKGGNDAFIIQIKQ